ncbi:hypothetical protein L228DRAFT_251029 [Xylona heveae TC161]|uniref:EF-hand domain-containing protein n=1 Tax=Xylona heveae (strain CBS 132557 / TC161) TaxID=1328760 RepID=A0A164ZRS7_XYLHT|nr:hypothetical protein L228DRAFT_251029 [Xylona heveae TC161]KZF19430.1 hypothetical protein L228DRAFT_251029 [Xylona heveae TC161]
MWKLAGVALLALSSRVFAHGDHDGQAALQGETDWGTIHMAEEHHIGNFEPRAFFSLHDFDSNGYWDPYEVLRTYGLNDDSLKDTPAEKRNEILTEVFRLFDTSGDRRITQAEWLQKYDEGVRLPDFGLGPGHHGDDEYEYEIHHFEKYHDENTREEDLTHPEDIEHFRKHDMEAEAAERQEQLDRMSIVEQNIPLKFRKTQ